MPFVAHLEKKKRGSYRSLPRCRWCWRGKKRNSVVRLGDLATGEEGLPLRLFPRLLNEGEIISWLSLFFLYSMVIFAFLFFGAASRTGTLPLFLRPWRYCAFILFCFYDWPFVWWWQSWKRVTVRKAESMPRNLFFISRFLRPSYPQPLTGIIQWRNCHNLSLSVTPLPFPKKTLKKFSANNSRIASNVWRNNQIDRTRWDHVILWLYLIFYLFIFFFHNKRICVKGYMLALICVA